MEVPQNSLIWKRGMFILAVALAIFRSVNNFVFVGDDGKTSAMRLGYARTPLTFENNPLFWRCRPSPMDSSRRNHSGLAA